jgi:hypothetical protein
MNKHLMKRSVTAALVAGGLVGLGAQPAQADGILFPYLSTQTGVFSFVSVVNRDVAVIVAPQLSFTYGHKAATAGPVVTSNTGSCSHFDAGVTSTQSDMMTFHVRGTITTAGASGFALFEAAGDGAGPGVGQLTSTPAPLPLDNQLTFLVVENNAADPANPLSLYGWAEVIDTTTNLSFAYSTNDYARVNGVASTTNFTTNVVTSPVGPPAGGIASGPVVLSWYPTAFVDTRWHILNVGTTGTMSPAVGGGIRQVFTVANAAVVPVGGAFNRDENFFSGARTQPIRCFGILNRGDLLSGGPLANTADGGWTRLVGGVAIAVGGVADDLTGAYALGTSFLTHKIQTVTPATGIAPRQLMNREPNEDPSFTP